MHLAGEMDVGACWGFADRAVLLEISLKPHSHNSELQQAPVIASRCMLCLGYAIP